MSQTGVTHRDAVASGSQDGAQTATTALAANSAREFFEIQNQGTNKLYVYFGLGASTSVYHFILKAASGAADGTGGSVSTTDVDYRGIITIAGTNPSYSVVEL